MPNQGRLRQGSLLGHFNTVAQQAGQWAYRAGHHGLDHYNRHRNLYNPVLSALRGHGQKALSKYWNKHPKGAIQEAHKARKATHPGFDQPKSNGGGITGIIEYWGFHFYKKPNLLDQRAIYTNVATARYTSLTGKQGVNNGQQAWTVTDITNVCALFANIAAYGTKYHLCYKDENWEYVNVTSGNAKLQVYIYQCRRDLASLSDPVADWSSSILTIGSTKDATQISSTPFGIGGQFSNRYKIMKVFMKELAPGERYNLHLRFVLNRSINKDRMIGLSQLGGITCGSFNVITGAIADDSVAKSQATISYAPAAIDAVCRSEYYAWCPPLNNVIRSDNGTLPTTFAVAADMMDAQTELPATLQTS